MSWSNNKELSSRADVIGCNSLIYIYIERERERERERWVQVTPGVTSQELHIL